MIAWYRLRREFRFFRLDRIQTIEIQAENFELHNMTLRKYFDKYH
uniref:WYL domain-containing protein n=1 Tax=Roseihalotalea indica TaxID=2867963 RepID=A0AA49GJK6_9BACT|nr:WYL domain-containing protein [Tunicatimonas sp. TK19036]